MQMPGVPVAPYVITPENGGLERIYAFQERARTVGAFVFDVESLGEYRGIAQVNDVRWIALATAGETVVIPLGHPNGNKLVAKAKRHKDKETGKFLTDPAVYSSPPIQYTALEAYTHLSSLFADPDVLKIAHNLPFDVISSAKYLGAPPAPPYADTMVGGWLLDENRLKGLKALITSRYGLTYDTEDVGKCIEKHLFHTVARYAFLDARMTWLLWRTFEPLLRADPRLWDVWRLEMENTEAVVAMGREGAYVDVPAMERYRDELTELLPSIERRVFRAASTVFNLGSVPQKQKILYGPEGANLEPTKLTPKGLKKQKARLPLDICDYSTDDEALKGHRGHPLVDAILEYQEVAKLKNTYLDGLLGTDEKPCIIFHNRIYSKFNQTGAKTGRFSSSEPNLQNVPSRTEMGRRLRDCYIAPPGWKFLIADYAQIEMRILAHYCRDGKLYAGFMDGLDAHTTTAAALFGVDPCDVTKFMRNVAKGCGFAVNYDAGADRVATMANISLRESKRFLALHEAEFPEIYEFKARLLREALKRSVPHVRTLLGRYRRLPDLRSPISSRRAAAQRQLCNSVCQGGNADLTKLAMNRLIKYENTPEDLRLVLTVHDELGAYIPEDQVDAGVAAMEWAMTGPGIQELLRVPILTDVKVCDRWSQAKD